MTKRLTPYPRTEYSQAQIRRAIKAAEYVHAHTCPNRADHEASGCIGAHGLVHTITIEALEWLDTQPRDAAAVRLAYHDQACVSGRECGSAEDHALRTQTKRAAALRKFHAQEQAKKGD